MPTVIVTGARGLVGDAVLRYFHAGGWRVIVACSGAVRATADEVATIAFRLDSVAANQEFEHALTRADVVIHCAAVLPTPGLDASSMRNLFLDNVRGTYDMMDMAGRNGIRRFVYVSTCSLFASEPEVNHEGLEPSPANEYALSKYVGELTAEVMSRRSSTMFYSLRIAAPYGARAPIRAVVPVFVHRALAGEPLELMGSGARQQVFTYVEDIARACMAAVHADAPGIYNVAGPRPISMQELAHAVVRAVGADASLIVLTQRPDPNDDMRRSVSLDKANRALGWSPVYDIDRGLAEMVNEIRNPRAPLLVAA